MKTKLLRKLREKGRNQITVYSITKTNGYPTGMSYGSPAVEGYYELFSSGDTEDDVKEKAFKVWFNQNKERIREKYRKYRRRYKFPTLSDRITQQGQKEMKKLLKIMKKNGM